jgi:predicted NBD/HSP70 family sugar kinase
MGGPFPGSAFGTQGRAGFFDSPCEVVVSAQSLLTRRTRSDGVVNRTDVPTPDDDLASELERVTGRQVFPENSSNCLPLCKRNSP